MPENPPPPGEVILYQTQDGRTRIDVRMDGETVWLTQAQMAALFQTTVQNVSAHILNIFEERELQQNRTIKDYLIVQREGPREVSRSVTHYNLDVIISVGYRVKSHRGTQFRMWATQRLREYIVKGFTLDDERLKQTGGGGYFEELLARIRDIRSSERVFYRKVLDIYALSIDYDPATEESKRFFATVQNKIHWAAHGHTAAEIIHARADARQPNMGLTTWKGERVRREDAAVAKNYLSAREIEALNLIVSLYLDFAELQARSRKPMYMSDWIEKLDGFLRLSDREILDHAGRISADTAKAKADREFEKFDDARRRAEDAQAADELAQQVKKLAPASASRPPAPSAKRRKKKD